MKILLGTLLCSFLLVSANSNYGREVHVENTHKVHKDNSIHMNNANFRGSSNVVVGHGNVVRSNGGFNNGQDYTIHSGDGKTYTYSEQHTSKDGQRVKNVHATYTDNSIHRNGANFEGARNVVIGNNKILPGGPAAQTGNTRNPRDTYNQQYDNSIKIKDFYVHGSAAINIGHNNRHKKDVELVGEKAVGEEELSRVKRWGLFGAKSNVQNHHHSHTDNSIHMNGANFAGSNSVVVGHGNRLSKRSVDEQSVEEDQLSRQKRWGFKLKSGVTNTHTEKTDNSIHMDSANFRNSQGVVIGHNNHLNKRSVDAVAESEEHPRQKRWSFKLKSNVENSHSTQTDNSIHMNHADFGGSSNVVIGNGNHLSKRSVGPRALPLESTVQPTDTIQEDAEKVRVKRKFFGSVAIHDMRTRPGPPVSLENLEGSGSVHIVIYDNTDPVTLRGAKITGAAHLIVH